MSKFRFVLPIAAAVGVISVLSCSNVEDALQQGQEVVQQAQCTSGQGEWDANIKKCVKCPEGTIKNGDGQCDVPAGDIKVIERDDGTSTIICPPRTKLNASGTGCVADVIATDTNAVASVFYCDYGKQDPNEVDLGWGIDCYPIEYSDECDKDWGKLVKSCNATDRRKDQPYFCDYGPVDPAHGGGCYRILNNGSDCDLEWGIVARSCGTQGRWPNGTVCPAGKTKIQVGNVNECRKTSDIGLTNGAYCDYGPFKLNNLNEVEGGCWGISTQEDRNNCLRWGKGVNTCPTYTCPAGTITNSYGGCDLPATTCPSGYTLVAGSCVENTGPNCPTGFTLINGSCVQNSGGSCPSGYTLVSGSCVLNSNGTKYCFYGTSDNCYQIGSREVAATEAVCKSNYGMVTTSCFNVTTPFCDYGAPVIDAYGDVSGGCYPIRNDDDLGNCYNIVSACPNYNCPAGTTKTDWGWPGQVGCEKDTVATPITPICPSGYTLVSGSCVPNSTTADKYCYYGRPDDCWPIGVADPETGDITSEASCESSYGKVVTSCFNVVIQYCDWGIPILEDGSVEKGCWAIKNSTELESCVNWSKLGPLDSCPNYTCPAGTHKSEHGWGDSGCELN